MRKAHVESTAWSKACGGEEQEFDTQYCKARGRGSGRSGLPMVLRVEKWSSRCLSLNGVMSEEEEE